MDIIKQQFNRLWKMILIVSPVSISYYFKYGYSASVL